MDSNALIADARAWVGVPFRHQGRSRSGIDCIGLLRELAAAHGYTDHDETGYSRLPFDGRMRAVLTQYLDSVSDLLAGDVVLMSFAGAETHVALYTERGTIIHAYQPRGKVVEHRLDDKWRRRIVGIYRWRD